MTARDFDRHDAVYCPARAPLRWAIALMVDTPCRSVGVLGHDGALLGWLTEQDALTAMHTLGGGGTHGLRVAHAMRLALQRTGSGVRPLPDDREVPPAPFELVTPREADPFPLTRPARRPVAPTTAEPAEPEHPPPATTEPAVDEPLARAFWGMSRLPWMTNAAEAMRFGLQEAQRLVPTEASFAYLYDIDDDVLRLVATNGHATLEPGRHVVHRSAAFARMALRNLPHPLELRDAEGAAQAQHGSPTNGLGSRTVLFVPMMRDKRLLGLLQLVNRDGASSFTDDDRSVVVYVGEQLAGFVADAARWPAGGDTAR